MSFINEKVQPEGLTFDDVLLVPAYSEVLPREVSVVTRFSRNIQLNIPIVSRLWLSPWPAKAVSA